MRNRSKPCLKGSLIRTSRFHQAVREDSDSPAGLRLQPSTTRSSSRSHCLGSLQVPSQADDDGRRGRRGNRAQRQLHLGSDPSQCSGRCPAVEQSFPREGPWSSMDGSEGLAHGQAADQMSCQSTGRTEPCLIPGIERWTQRGDNTKCKTRWSNNRQT